MRASRLLNGDRSTKLDAIFGFNQFNLSSECHTWISMFKLKIALLNEYHSLKSRESQTHLVIHLGWNRVPHAFFEIRTYHWLWGDFLASDWLMEAELYSNPPVMYLYRIHHYIKFVCDRTLNNTVTKHGWTGISCYIICSMRKITAVKLKITSI